MRHSSQPTNQCKGRSEPITENSSSDQVDLVGIALPCPDASARSRPTTAPDGSPSCGTALADAAPTFQARIDAFGIDNQVMTPGNRGATMNSPTFRYPMPAADPRTGRGECATGDTRPCLCRPPPRHRRRPPPHPDRPAGPRGLTLLRQAGSQLLPQRCFDRGSGSSAPGTVRRCLKRLEDLGYIRREFVQATPANPTGRLIHLTCTEPDWPRPSIGIPPPSAGARLPPVPCIPTPNAGTPTPCADERTPRARRTPKENFQKKKNVTLRSFPRYANRSSLYRVAQVFLCVHLVPKPQPPAPSSRPRTALRRLKSRPVAHPGPQPGHSTRPTPAP